VSSDNECTKIISKRECAKTIVATVVDPILTSFCNRIKAVRTLAAAKLPVLRDVAGLANFTTDMQLSECVQ